MRVELLVEQLTASRADLVERWESLKLLWADSVQRDFERRFWESLDTQVETVRSQLEDFARAIEDARRVLNDG